MEENNVSKENIYKDSSKDIALPSSKEPWFSKPVVQGSLVILSILSVAGITSSAYEGFRIPSLNTQIEGLQNKINQKDEIISKLNEQIKYLKDESEIAKLTKSNLYKDELLKAKNGEIDGVKGQLLEIDKARNKLAQQVEHLNKAISQRQLFEEKVNQELSLCKKDLNLENKINSLRHKIELNNKRIADNTSFRPNDREVNNLFIDNQNLNLSIIEYQKKLQCQN